MKSNSLRKYNWSWCDLCESAMVLCPQCGNNSCNGHYGCDLCRDVQSWINQCYNEDHYPKTKEEVEEYNKSDLLS
jgi:hypothetical protein